MITIRMFDFPVNLNTFVALLLTAGGTMLFLRSIWHLLLAIESRSWPTAQGIMLSAKLIEERDSEGDRLYQARVAYRFVVDGREFVGHRAIFGDSDQTSWSLFARRVVAKYRPGAAVRVYYNPLNPTEAVLESGISGAIIAMLALEVIFLSFAIWFLRTAIAA